MAKIETLCWYYNVTYRKENGNVMHIQGNLDCHFEGKPAESEINIIMRQMLFRRAADKNYIILLFDSFTIPKEDQQNFEASVNLAKKDYEKNEHLFCQCKADL